MNKEQHRRVFWENWAAKAKESGEHVRYMLGIDDVNEATTLSESDVSEIMDILPDLTGKEVLELASGVGYVLTLATVFFPADSTYLSRIHVT